MERSARLPIWAGRPPWADDALLAAGLAAFGVVGTLGAVDNQPTSRPPGLLGWGLLLAASAAVVFRRRSPGSVLAVTAAATVGWLAARHPYGPVFLPLCVAVYTAAASWPRGRFPALAAAVGGLLVVLVAVGVADGRGRLDEVPGQLSRVLLAWATLLGVPLWVGWAARVRRERAVQDGRRRADEDRLRVARELHDVVSHSIAMINFRAGVALHVIEQRPEEARAALEAIRQGSAGAMQELRAAIGVLHDPGGDGSPRAPVAGLAQLEELVAGVAGAGQAVELVVTGDPVELPPAVDLAAYRVVQESLTNVVRHAGPATATVRVAYQPGGVLVEVSDDGPGPGAAAKPGSGIQGMRDRVAAAGGELDAGPCPGGGFQVTARLPR
jgi:signal transduction histidine kinase